MEAVAGDTVKQSLKGIRGWLLFFAIFLIVQIGISFNNLGMIVAGTTPESVAELLKSEAINWKIYIFLSIGIQIFSGILSAWIFGLLLIRQLEAEKIIIFGLWGKFVVLCIAHALDYYVDRSNLKGPLLGLAYTVVGQAVWIRYFSVSKRVKETFVEKYVGEAFSFGIRLKGTFSQLVAKRRQFWAIFICMATLSMFTEAFRDGGTLQPFMEIPQISIWVFVLVILIFGFLPLALATAVGRWHDAGCKKSTVALLFIPGINTFTSLYLLFKGSEESRWES